MRISAASVWVAPRTSPLKSSRILLVATLPTTAPKASRMISVGRADVAASLHRTGQLRGRRRRPRWGEPQDRRRLEPTIRPSVLDHVAGAPFGVEQARLAAGLELAAQVGDEDVDRVGRSGRVVAPDLVEEPLAGYDEPVVSHQELEQLELAVGELDLALAAHDLAGVGIEREIADLEGGGSARRPPAQQSPDPGEQLAALEGLDEVVVGAAVEAVDPILGLGARGQHQDRHVAVGPETAADLDPVEAGQAEVED